LRKNIDLTGIFKRGGRAQDKSVGLAHCIKKIGPHGRAVAAQALVPHYVFDNVQIEAEPLRRSAQHCKRCGRDFRPYSVAGERYKPHEENNCIRECAV
jgi:hypothetical protein